MLANHEPDRNVEDLTNPEIYAAIRYLDAAETSAEVQNREARNREELRDDNAVVICVCLYVALLGCLAFVWLYLR
ncbi:MAG TPA: hypothetical protein VKR59_16960 [Terriglobales bacterium]|nr:hypothetical protein [Terriglobales bacterium]